MNLEFLSKKGFQDRINISKSLECIGKDHPYESEILVPYHPKRNVTVGCSNCGWVYQRPPTPNEIQTYEEMLKLEINI